jgi:hypothetical protein
MVAMAAQCIDATRQFVKKASLTQPAAGRRTDLSAWQVRRFRFGGRLPLNRVIATHDQRAVIPP